MRKGSKVENFRMHEKLFAPDKSQLAKYQEIFVGRKGLAALLKYEVIMGLSSWVPGALGLLLRKKLYARLLRKTGKGVIFGRNVVLRHPHKISLGDHVAIDDNCVLDAKGADNQGITVGSNVIIGRNASIYCKDGDVEIGDDVSISFNSTIFSANMVKVGSGTRIAAYSYLNGGSHATDRTDIPIWQQERSGKGITLEENVWLGADVKVLDGSTIGRDAVVGAGAVVTTDIPAFGVAAGMPAKVLRSRLATEAKSLVD